MNNNVTTAIAQPNNKGKIKGSLLEKAVIEYKVEDENFYEGKIVVERLSEANFALTTR